MSVSTRITFILAASMVVAAISGYGAASWGARKTATTPAILTARQFVLVDEAGHIGAKLTWEDHQPAIRLFDSTNHLRSALFLESNGVPDLYLYDSNDKVRAALNLFDSGIPIWLLWMLPRNTWYGTQFDENSLLQYDFCASARMRSR